MIGHCCVRYYVLVSSAEDTGSLGSGLFCWRNDHTFTCMPCNLVYPHLQRKCLHVQTFCHNSWLENGDDTACHHSLQSHGSSACTLVAHFTEQQEAASDSLVA